MSQNTLIVLSSASGSVTTVSVATANGFAATVANATTTPAITLTTSITGLLKGNGTAISAASSNVTVRPFGITIDGGGATITTGIKGDIVVPYACTITGWTLLGDQSGSIVVDVWKDTYANYPPTVADTITGADKPTISAATKGQNLTLALWTTAVAAGDTLRFNVDSITTLTRVVLMIQATVTI